MRDQGPTAGAKQEGRPSERFRLMTLLEVAQYLAVSPKTVRRLVGRGKLSCVRVGRVLRFQQADLFRFVEARRE